MDWNFFNSSSLKTKVTLSTLAIFLVVIWSLAYYASNILRDDMQRLIGQQQTSMVSYIAADISKGLEERVNALELIAKAIDPALLDNPAALQKFISNRFVLFQHFNYGVMVVSDDGTVIADAPLPLNRVGINYLFRDYISGALNEGKPIIGLPIMGLAAKAPVFGIGVPIRNAQGKVIGAIAGVTNLGMPNFLDQIQVAYHSNKGGYVVLVSPKQRVIIAASDKNRAMEALPAPGVNPVIDRFVEGFEGSTIFTTPSGVEVLGSVKSVHMTGWYAAILLPTDELFTPIHDMQQRMLLATILLTLLAGVLIWWVLKRQLSPMLIAARALSNISNISDSNQLLQPLPISKQDEIGQLIGGFNHLIKTLKKKDIALHKSEELYRVAFQTSLDSININRLVDGLYLEVNQSFLDLMGYTRAEIIGHTSIELDTWNDSGDRQHLIEKLQRDGKYENLEVRFKKKNGELVWGLMSASIIELDGVPCILSISRDITDRKRIDEKLSLSESSLKRQNNLLASLLKALPVGVFMVEAPSGKPLVANDAALKLLGRGILHDANKVNLSQVYNAYKIGSSDPYPIDEMPIMLGLRGITSHIDNMEIRRPDSTTSVLEVFGTPIMDEEGNIWASLVNFSDISQRKEHEAELQRIAYYDTLTNLPNRVLLADRLNLSMAQARRRGQPLAVVYLDLDDFKPINDRHGHEVGDQMLVKLANSMKQVLREGDTLARLGGDEFIAVLLDVPDIEASVPVLNRLLAAARQPTQIGDFMFKVSASVGITFYPQTEDMDADQLLRQADNAMYQAKQAGKNRYHLFDAEQDRSVRSHLEGLDRMRQALSEQEFVLYYQPQVDMVSGKVVGAEALIRWMHPEQGLLSPGAFLHYLEGSELEIEVGEWVIDDALKQIETWNTSGLTLSVSANISADHLLRPDFAERLRLALSRHPSVDPASFELEILETAAMSDMSQAVNALTRCHEMGVRISLDDFGTGYSSLTYLRTLPVDILKIDQSFVRDMLTDPSDLGIVTSVIQLAQTFKRDVIAEGVETLEHGAMLIHLGCRLMQGYGIARPMPADQMSDWIGQWRDKAPWLSLEIPDQQS